MSLAWPDWTTTEWEVFLHKPSVKALKFDEAQHPRVPAGNSDGGEFTAGVNRLTRPTEKAVAPHGLPALARKAATHEPAAERFWLGLLQDLRATEALDGEKQALAAVKDWAKGLQAKVEDALEPAFLEGAHHGAAAAGVTIAARKYTEDQPRVPAGSPDGGQFGSAFAAIAERLDVDVDARARDVLDAFQMSNEGDDALAAVLSHFKATPVHFENGDDVHVLTDHGETYVVDDEGNYTQADEWVNQINDPTDYYPTYEDQFNSDFWESPGALYHYTNEEKVDEILANGLNASHGTGLTNRGEVGVFTTSDPETYADGTYGDVLLEIDTEAMKRDGRTPRVSREPSVVEAELLDAIANRLGLRNYQSDTESDMSPDTVVVGASIPAKYLRRIDGGADLKGWTWKYSESQPRVPAGSPEGGQFGSGAGGSQIDTPEFKAWFGDSVVVDANGKPLVMYHATDANIDEFRPFTHFGTQEAANARAENLASFYENVLDRPDRSRGANVMPVYLKVEHPLEMPDLASIDSETGGPLPDNWDDAGPDDELHYPRGWEGEEAIATTLLERGVIDIDEFEEHRSNSKALQLLAEKGYDGIVYENAVEDPGSKSWIVFSPEQVKSALGNRGTFNPKDPKVSKAGQQAQQDGPISFTLINQRAIDWAAAHATELIDDLSQTSLDGIKQLVEEALGGKWTTAQVARLIRTVIGLRADQVTAVARERERLIKRGLPEATVDARVGRYAQGQLRQRANVIAHHEIMASANAGQQAIWDEALAKGYLKASETFKTLEIAEDEITCDICRDVSEDDPVPVNEPFSTGDMSPPLHVRCRCGMSLKFAKAGD